jgi:hypothetical protein
MQLYCGQCLLARLISAVSKQPGSSVVRTTAGDVPQLATNWPQPGRSLTCTTLSPCASYTLTREPHSGTVSRETQWSLGRAVGIG